MEKIKNEKLFMKTICTLLAVVLWFYVSYYENPTMTKTVRDVPLSISEEQISRLRDKGLSVQSISTEQVDVKVSARRLNLVKASNKTLTARINVSAINKTGTYTLPAIVTSDEDFDASFFVKGKDIKIVIEPVISTSFTIEPNIEHSHIAYDDVALNAERVIVTAPQSILDEIGSVKTEQIVVDEKKDTEKAKLVIYDKNGEKLNSRLITTSLEEVQLSFSYLEDKKVSVMLKTRDNKTFRLPSLYDVTIYGKEETINNISAIETEGIDLSEYNSGEQVHLKLDVPENIKLKENNAEIDIVLQSHYFE